jgi:pimeloyl-ACP methyl ester carboxylesterase
MRYPELVSGLILADSSVGSGTTSSQAKLMRGRASVLEEKGATVFAEERSHLLVAPGTDVDVVKRVEQLFADSIRMPGYAWACDSMADTDHSDMLENVKAPTLVVYGVHDIVTPPEASRILADGISRSVLKEINAAGHLANQEQPAAFNESVISFLNSL